MSTAAAYDADELGDAAAFAALDAEIGAACLALAPQFDGTAVALSDLDALCAALQRPVRDDRERAELMTRLDPENAMRIDRTAVTTWLLEEDRQRTIAAMAASSAASSAAVRQRPTAATPMWEEIIEAGSVFYYNTYTGETAWTLAHPLATCLYKHVQDVAEIQSLQAARDADGFLLDGTTAPSGAPSVIEMVDDLQRTFAKHDDDRDGHLDANEFRDLCVTLSFPLGLVDEAGTNVLAETMRAVDAGAGDYGTNGVSWDALLAFWITHVPWQRRTRLAAPFDEWEQLERLDSRTQVPWFRHTTTLRERWSPPNTDHAVVELLTKLFPSAKLTWQQRIEMIWELQLQLPSGAVPAAVWTLRETRALLEQLGWDGCTRREHVASIVRSLQQQFGNGNGNDHGCDGTLLSKETLMAWLLDCVARVEMDGWQECIDASSGQRYYYHEVRGLTQWDAPQLENRMATMMARFAGHGSRDGSDDQITRIFRHYDDDESGSISFHEFKRLYVALLGRKEAITGDSEADDAQIQQVFSVLDTSGDDAVSLDEFLVWWKTKMNIEDDETEQQRRMRVAADRQQIAMTFLVQHDALIQIQGEDANDQDVQSYAFESNMLARLVAVLGKYTLHGIAYRDALAQLVHTTGVADQAIVLAEFLDWYVSFEDREREKEELAAQKARALAQLQAQDAEAKEKARKLKMIRKGQLITKKIASDAMTKSGVPEPAEVIWTRHIQTLFRKFDKDNSGFLDAEELQALTNALGHALDHAQITQMIAIMDTSGDARVSVDEFVTFWTAFQRRQRAAADTDGTQRKQAKAAKAKETAKTATTDEPHRREAISMVDATANLAVSMELAKERALKLTLHDVKDALSDWKESLLDRSRKTKDANALALQQRERLDALRKEWEAFVPTTTRRYAHLDVTWIEPEVVRCVVDLIERVRVRAHPLPREDAAQRIQRIVRGVVTRMRLFAMVRLRFHAYVDLTTNFFYYVDTAARHCVWLHRPLFRTITSSVRPWDLEDCTTKIERLRFRHDEQAMAAKQRFYHRVVWPDETLQHERSPLFVPASFVVFDVLETVRQRLVGNLWHALRDRSFVLAELMAQRHIRQLTQRSDSDASAPLPLHFAIQHHRDVPFRLLRAIYDGYPDAVRVRDAYGRTPLHLALRERAGQRVLALLLSRRRCLVDPPTRATPTPTSVWAMQTVSGETPLHVALRYSVPLELLRWLCRHQSLTDVAATVSTIRNQHGHTIFHLVVATLFDATDARSAAYWRSVVLVLLRTWPHHALCSIANGHGELPLHLAIERYADRLHQQAMTTTARCAGKPQAPTAEGEDQDAQDQGGSWRWLIRRLMTDYPDALLTRRTHDGLLAIHLLLRARRIPESLVRETLEATIAQWPERETVAVDLLTMLTLRTTQTTLLHYTLLHRAQSESLLLYLLDELPGACRVAMQPAHELPLHLAARHGASVAVITRLCELYGAGCQARNAKHELPLHVAVQSVHASDATVQTLLHYCPFVLSDPTERLGLRALVMAANVAAPRASILRALLEYTPPQPQQRSADARKRYVTPLYALSMRPCDAALASSDVLEELATKFEAVDDEDAYFLAMAKARHRKQHHCPTAHWPFPKILELMERNPVDEAIIQRALLALHEKVIQMMRSEEPVTPSNQDGGGGGGSGLGVVVETVTLQREWMLVRRVHHTLYELPWNARVQLLGQTLLAKLLPTAFAKAAYKARVDPYFNL